MNDDEPKKINKQWVPYRLVLGSPIVDIYRYTTDEATMLHQMAVAITEGFPPEEVHRYFRNTDEEVYKTLMAVCEQASASADKGYVVDSCALNDWVPPMDDLL